GGIAARELAWRNARGSGYPEQRRAELHQHGGRRLRRARDSGVPPMMARTSEAGESTPTERGDAARASARAGGSGGSGGSKTAKVLVAVRPPLTLVAAAVG